ncbi:MAG: MFS transporter [Gaiellaceae bacterium]
MRRLLALVCSIVFVDAMLFGALTPLVPGYARELELTKVGAGLLVAAFGAGAVLGGVPGGLAAARYGSKLAVVGGLLLLGAASIAFATADSALGLGAARFVQGFASTVTWAGALAWIAEATPRARRGEVIGTVFGAAVAGAILGPMFGGIAEVVGIATAFVAVGLVAWAFAGLSAVARPARVRASTAGSLSRVARDPRFLGGLWLTTLPAFLFGTLVVLAPLALDAAGWATLGIAALFLVSGLAEVVINPFLGRATDRVGRLVPIRIALGASIVVATLLAVSTHAAVIAVLVCAAAIGFGSLYTPSMTLASHRAEVSGLAQGLAFGIMNTAWALGNMTGPAVSGVLAESFGDAPPYLLGAALCALTLAATFRFAPWRMSPRET